MQTAIEITSRCLRLALVRDGRLADLVERPLVPDQDPVDQLQAAALPAPLGPVRVLIQHEDLLIRTLVQPACPRDRLDKVVRFELAGMDPAEPLLVDWQPVPGPGDDQRVLALLAKRGLADRLAAALAGHGGRLEALTLPGSALVHAWTAQQAPADEQAVLVDVGGARIHLALVDGGQPVLIRSVPGGADEITREISERRGVAVADAQAILAGLGAGAPEDLLDLVRSHAGQVASAITAAERFAKAQFRLDRFEPAAVYLSGAGAQVPAFLTALGARLGRPVRVFNPFAGVPLDMSRSALDRIAGLPSPWTPVLAAAAAPALVLDAV
ncbi:MAG: type pilus biosis protein PilM, partial [Planctomycetota bacterium]